MDSINHHQDTHQGDLQLDLFLVLLQELILQALHRVVSHLDQLLVDFQVLLLEVFLLVLHQVVIRLQVLPHFLNHMEPREVDSSQCFLLDQNLYLHMEYPNQLHLQFIHHLLVQLLLMMKMTN